VEHGARSRGVLCLATVVTSVLTSNNTKMSVTEAWLILGDMERGVPAAAAEYHRPTSSDVPNSSSTISTVSYAPCVVFSSTPATSSV